MDGLLRVFVELMDVGCGRVFSWVGLILFSMWISKLG